MQKNQTVSLASMNEAKLMPQRLQAAIDEYFSWHGTMPEIDAKLFEIVEFAIAGLQETGIDAKEVVNYLFFYKTTKVLLTELSTFTAKSSSLCQN